MEEDLARPEAITGMMVIANGPDFRIGATSLGYGGFQFALAQAMNNEYMRDAHSDGLLKVSFKSLHLTPEDLSIGHLGCIRQECFSMQVQFDLKGGPLLWRRYSGDPPPFPRNMGDRTSMHGKSRLHLPVFPVRKVEQSDWAGQERGCIHPVEQGFGSGPNDRLRAADLSQSQLLPGRDPHGRLMMQAIHRECPDLCPGMRGSLSLTVLRRAPFCLEDQLAGHGMLGIIDQQDVELPDGPILRVD